MTPSTPGQSLAPSSGEVMQVVAASRKTAWTSCIQAETLIRGEAATDQVGQMVVPSQRQSQLVLGQARGERHKDGRVAEGAVRGVAGDGGRLPGGHKPSALNLDTQ